MLYQTPFKTFQSLAKQHRSIGVSREIPVDHLTPIQVYYVLGDLTRRATLLESYPSRPSLCPTSFAAPESGYRARYSFIGLEPIAEFHRKNTRDGLNELRQFYRQQICQTTHPLSGFVGGIVGFISYEAAHAFENLIHSQTHADENFLPDFSFISYRTNITFDHHTHQVILTRRVEVGEDPAQDYKQAHHFLSDLIAKISVAKFPAPLVANVDSTADAPHPDLNDAEFIAKVQQAQTHILAGDIFQVVLSRTFKKQITAAPFTVYRALRMVSPAPYLFYLDRGEYVLTGASPEKLISIVQNNVSSFPIAGTRPRGITPEKDQLLAQELQQDEKERAEHLMLVDLARNDLGRICIPGSVQVKKFNQVQHYSHVMHLTSEVVGHLQPDVDAFDALKATFPAGTLSGAPKIRSMEIIATLERSPRGTYGGAVCFIDAQGNLNSCITIRSALIENGVATVRTGAGIVYDSDPQKEADETKHKAQSVLAALNFSEETLP